MSENDFTHQGTRYTAVAITSDECTGCAFNGENCTKPLDQASCFASQRQDGRMVIFIATEKEKS